MSFSINISLVRRNFGDTRTAIPDIGPVKGTLQAYHSNVRAAFPTRFDPPYFYPFVSNIS